MNPGPAPLNLPPTGVLKGGPPTPLPMPDAAHGAGGFTAELERQLQAAPVGAAPPDANATDSPQAALGATGAVVDRSPVGNGMPGDGNPVPESAPIDGVSKVLAVVTAEQMAGLMPQAPDVGPGGMLAAAGYAFGPFGIDSVGEAEEDTSLAPTETLHEPTLADLLTQGLTSSGGVGPVAVTPASADAGALGGEHRALAGSADPGEQLLALANDGGQRDPREGGGLAQRDLSDVIGLLAGTDGRGGEFTAEGGTGGLGLSEATGNAEDIPVTNGPMPVADSMATGSTPGSTPASPVAPAPLPGEPSATPAQTALAATVGTADWFDELGHGLHWLVGEGESEARLRLNPAELGMLEVQVRITERGTEVHFMAPHPQAREALEQGLARLRESLEQQGLQLADASVSDGRSQQGRQEERAQAYARLPGAGWSSEDGVAIDLSGKPVMGRGLIDLYA